MRSDATRFLRDGVLTVAYEAGGAPALARVAQKPDGRLDATIEGAEPDEALDRLRFVLAVNEDHREFLRRFRDDHLIGRAVRTLAGMRPIRTATVAHSPPESHLRPAHPGQRRAPTGSEARPARLPRAPRVASSPRRRTFQRFTRADLARHGPVSRKGLCAPAAHEGARPRAAARPHDGDGRAPDRARARPRPLVGGSGLPLRPRPLRVRARGRPRARQARLGAPGPLGRHRGDPRAPRALRRVGRARERLHAGGNAETEEG
jgi:hypothetical protein